MTGWVVVGLAGVLATFGALLWFIYEVARGLIGGK